jgi:hypothetical protein
LPRSSTILSFFHISAGRPTSDRLLHALCLRQKFDWLKRHFIGVREQRYPAVNMKINCRREQLQRRRYADDEMLSSARCCHLHSSPQEVK